MPLLEASFRTLLALSPDELAVRLDRFDRRGAGFRWEEHVGFGWALAQDEDAATTSGVGLYTLRTSGGDFPAGELAAAMNGLRRVHAARAEEAWIQGAVRATARQIVASVPVRPTPPKVALDDHPLHGVGGAGDAAHRRVAAPRA